MGCCRSQYRKCANQTAIKYVMHTFRTPVRKHFNMKNVKFLFYYKKRHLFSDKKSLEEMHVGFFPFIAVQEMKHPVSIPP